MNNFLLQRQSDRARILQLFDECWRDTGNSRWAALRFFCDSWPVTCYPFDRELQARYPRLIPTTVNRWLTARENSGSSDPAPGECWRRSIVLEGEMGAAVKALLWEDPGISAAQLHRLVSKAFPDAPTVKTFQRALIIYRAGRAE